MVVTPDAARGNTALRQPTASGGLATLIPVTTQLENGSPVPNVASCHGTLPNLAGDFAGSVLMSVDAVKYTMGEPLSLPDDPCSAT